MKKFQQILTLALSLGFLAVFSAWFLIAPDAEESTVERRRLAKRPALSFSSVTNGSFMNGFEKYMLDQFPLRNGFRGAEGNRKCEGIHEKGQQRTLFRRRASIKAGLPDRQRIG